MAHLFRYTKYGLLFWFLSASTSTHADIAANSKSLAPDPVVAKYLVSREVTQRLREMGRAWDAELKIQENCKKNFEVSLPPGAIAILEPINISAGALHPTHGVWQYKFAFARCGDVKIYNVLAIAEQNRPPKYIKLVPGLTVASPILIRDVLPVVLTTVSARSGFKGNEKCEDFAITDTKISVPPRLVKPGENPLLVEPWDESWTVRYCSRTHDVPICFTPDKSGGTAFATERCSH